MLTFDISVSGTQVGSQLVNDPEEMAYCLAEMADSFKESLAEEVIGLLPYDKNDEVKAMCELLIKAIDDVN